MQEPHQIGSTLDCPAVAVRRDHDPLDAERAEHLADLGVRAEAKRADQVIVLDEDVIQLRVVDEPVRSAEVAADPDQTIVDRVPVQVQGDRLG